MASIFSENSEILRDTISLRLTVEAEALSCLGMTAFCVLWRAGYTVRKEIKEAYLACSVGFGCS